ncbi:MAG TPA: methylmalonyl-CoA mutase family protein [bacterium]|nr:methylmalonyl-CoA mutase family protein [bacterium]HPS29663.1 methylmalonyl-CoA mutase family protein [bacterium]
MSISAEFAKWKEGAYGKTVAKFPERKQVFKTSFNEEIAPVYVPGFEDPQYLETRGLPGLYPFTRGVQSTMYRGKFWTMRQYAGFGTAEESNKRYKYLLGAGQTGLSVAFDLPTQIGYDSDHPMSDGEVGKVGVAIDSLKDMEILFDGIPLGEVSTSMTINSTAGVLLAMYIAVAEKQGFTPDKLNGTIQNDILKEYIARGTYRFPPKPSMRLITDIFEYCAKNVTKWNTISISGYHIREAGSNAVQEVAFTIADGIAYADAAIKAGMDIDVFAPRLSFFFNAHNNLLEEVAKFRAARRLWAEIMKNRFNAKDVKSQMLRFHTQTAGCTLTAQQPDNNIVRVTMQTLAATLGGTQSLHTNSRDEALALPTEDSVRIALRTQQIVAYESGIADTIDPLAGSYFVEALTDSIYAKAKKYIERIDELGGMVEAIEKGFVQQEIQDSAYTYQLEVERGEQIVVGVNKFQVKELPPSNLLKVDRSIQVSQIAKINAVKASRDNELVARKLAEIKAAAQGTENLMPKILEAVKVYATLGEITGTMQEVFGEHKESVVL